ncbi:MAG: Histidyl-tRNA synthetase [Thermodesulfobacterium sp.]|uniref:Histidine--tRNA ligase n=1 Tax=Candidatus Thermodesulfobacterium syntrophicum TaxID=3060442 RepID=A0AAE3P4Z2_9BACT|nr:Histidyl-tRNA synthetase [Candidatus Thermodesulfobacterium syntrophicum]
MKIQAVRGFKDWLPEDFVRYEYLINIARGILKNYNYKEIKIPILEKTDLFVRSIGEFTDIVQKETYTFLDRNKEFLTLRPEATAGICRMVIEKGLFVSPKPLKFFTIGPMFRHERPQKGRLREFFQIDVELFSELNPYIEAEIVFLAMEILKAPICLFKKDLPGIYALELNSLGCPKCRPKYKEALIKFLKEKKEILCETCKQRIVKNPLRVLDCKVETCKEVVSRSPVITEYLCKGCKTHFENIKDILKFMGVQYIENPRLVRGLDYYVRTIFEIKAEGLGAQDTVAAGGRYDFLLKELGGQHLPAIGFAIGLERWAISIFGDKKNKGILSSEKFLEKLCPDVFIILLGKELLMNGLKLATLLRKKGLRCEVTYEEKSLKAQLKNADKLSAKYSLILGEEEIKKRSAILRDMRKGIQKDINFENWEDLSYKVYKEIKE